MKLKIGEFNGLVITRESLKHAPRSLEAQQTLQGIARWILRAISSFMDLHRALCAGLPSKDSDE